MLKGSRHIEESRRIIKISSSFHWKWNRANLDTVYCSKKYISEKEKGIVLVSFENQLEKLANLSKLNDFEKEYQGYFSSKLATFL